MGLQLDPAPGGPVCFCWHGEAYLGGPAGQEGWVNSVGNLDGWKQHLYAIGLLKGDGA